MLHHRFNKQQKGKKILTFPQTKQRCSKAPLFHALYKINHDKITRYSITNGNVRRLYLLLPSGERLHVS